MELYPERLVHQAPMPSMCEGPPQQLTQDVHALKDQPRTPLRNISNSQARAPALHKAVLALRQQDKTGTAAGPQVRGAHIALATSPLSQRAAAIPTRSPMAGRTPDDVRRAAKKGSVSQPPFPVSLGLWKEVIDAKSGRPYYWHTGTSQVTWSKPPEVIAHADISAQLQLHFAKALVTANADEIISSLASPLKQMNAAAAAASAASVCVPPDPVAEAARLKREEAKAKREAKKAGKIEQDRQRLAQEQREAQERAALLEEQNAAVLEIISNMSADEDQSCKLEDIEPLRSVPHELVALCQSLQLISSKIYMLPLELHQVEDALRARKPALEHENVLAALHAPLLAAARGATKAAASKAPTSSWTTEVKKWAFTEMGKNSPFIDAGLAKQKKEGALEYKQLSYPQKLSLASLLSAEALSRLLAAAPEDISEECVAALRPSPLGHDKDGRAYWHGANPSGTASAWLLRESLTEQPQRSRLSVLSSDGTPIKGDVSRAAADRCAAEPLLPTKEQTPYMSALYVSLRKSIAPLLG